MAIQYPKSTHVTLPSVEQWGTNTNILRDPPRSITTRRIDKVGQNVDISSLVDDSGDRICEGINVYARGVNPMVSVSYDNVSNNAGMSGNATSYSNRPAARAPYPAFEGGSFRPPVRTERDLLPLSRQPRAWFGTTGTKEFIDYAKTKQQPNDFRAIRELALHAFDVAPNKTTTIEKAILENFEMTDHINDAKITLFDTSAGCETGYQSSFTKENPNVQKAALDEVLHARAILNRAEDRTAGMDGVYLSPDKYITQVHQIEQSTNRSAHQTQDLSDLSIQSGRYITDVNQIEQTTNRSAHHTQDLSELSIQPDRYITSIHQIERPTNVSRDIQAKKIDELVDSNRRVSVKPDMIQFESHAGRTPIHTFLNEIATPELELRNPMVCVTAARTQADVAKRVDHDKGYEFERNMPLTQARTNITKIDDFHNLNLSSRTYRLDPTLQKGGFGNVGAKPSFGRGEVRASTERESDKDKLRNRINDMQFNRF